MSTPATRGPHRQAASLCPDAPWQEHHWVAHNACSPLNWRSNLGPYAVAPAARRLQAALAALFMLGVLMSRDLALAAACGLCLQALQGSKGLSIQLAEALVPALGFVLALLLRCRGSKPSRKWVKRWHEWRRHLARPLACAVGLYLGLASPALVRDGKQPLTISVPCQALLGAAGALCDPFMLAGHHANPLRLGPTLSYTSVLAKALGLYAAATGYVEGSLVAVVLLAAGVAAQGHLVPFELLALAAALTGLLVLQGQQQQLRLCAERAAYTALLPLLVLTGVLHRQTLVDVFHERPQVALFAVALLAYLYSHTSGASLGSRSDLRRVMRLALSAWIMTCDFSIGTYSGGAPAGTTVNWCSAFAGIRAPGLARVCDVFDAHKEAMREGKVAAAGYELMEAALSTGGKVRW